MDWETTLPPVPPGNTISAPPSSNLKPQPPPSGPSTTSHRRMNVRYTSDSAEIENDFGASPSFQQFASPTPKGAAAGRSWRAAVAAEIEAATQRGTNDGASSHEDDAIGGSRSSGVVALEANVDGEEYEMAEESYAPIRLGTLGGAARATEPMLRTVSSVPSESVYRTTSAIPADYISSVDEGSMLAGAQGMARSNHAASYSYRKMMVHIPHDSDTGGGYSPGKISREESGLPRIPHRSVTEVGNPKGYGVSAVSTPSPRLPSIPNAELSSPGSNAARHLRHLKSESAKYDMSKVRGRVAVHERFQRACVHCLPAVFVAVAL